MYSASSLFMWCPQYAVRLWGFVRGWIHWYNIYFKQSDVTWETQAQQDKSQTHSDTINATLF